MADKDHAEQRIEGARPACSDSGQDLQALFQGKDDVIVTDKIELYCDADRRSGIPQEDLEKHSPTLGECMEAYHGQGV